MFVCAIVLKVFNVRLKTTTIMKVPATTFEQAIGFIGGLLGLWLGASMLTLFEVFEFVINIVAWVKRRFLSSNQGNAVKAF